MALSLIRTSGARDEHLPLLVGVSVGEGKFCPFFETCPKIFWCLGRLPQAAVSRYYV